MIKAADGHLVPSKTVLRGSDALVVMSHGITTGKEEDGLYTDFAENTLAPRFDSIRFDFRGHGESAIPSHQATVAGEVLDLMAVMKWARESQYQKVFHLATSFGASVTLLAASRFSFSDLSGVAFWNPVISYRSTFIESKVQWAHEFFDHQREEELAYRTGTKIPETDFIIGPQLTMELLLLYPEQTRWPANVPLLVVHGDADTCVPFEDAEEYATRNHHSVQLSRVPGVDHGFDNKIRDVFQKTLHWFNEHA